jgi:hypothetical protein
LDGADLEIKNPLGYLFKGVDDHESNKKDAKQDYSLVVFHGEPFIFSTKAY